MPTPTIVMGVLGLLATVVMGRVYVGLMRVASGRARNLAEGMMPQRIVYRRLLREIHRERGR